MKNPPLVPRTVALFLSLSLALAPSASALREEPPRETKTLSGLEEALTSSQKLTSHSPLPPTAGLEEEGELWLRRSLKETDVDRLNGWLNQHPEFSLLPIVYSLHQGEPLEWRELANSKFQLNVNRLRDPMLHNLVTQMEQRAPGLKDSASWAALKRQWLEDYFESGPDGLVVREGVSRFGARSQALAMLTSGADEIVRSYATLFLLSHYYGDTVNSIFSLQHGMNLFLRDSGISHEEPIISRFNSLYEETETLVQEYKKKSGYPMGYYGRGVREELLMGQENLLKIKGVLGELQELIASETFVEKVSSYSYSSMGQEQARPYHEIFPEAVQKAVRVTDERLEIVRSALSAGGSASTAGLEERTVLARLGRLHHMADTLSGIYGKRNPRPTQYELLWFIQQYDFYEKMIQGKNFPRGDINFEKDIPVIYWPRSRPTESPQANRKLSLKLALRLAAFPVIVRELHGWISSEGLKSDRIMSDAILSGGDVLIDIEVRLVQDFKMKPERAFRLVKKNKALLISLIDSIKRVVGIPTAGLEEGLGVATVPAVSVAGVQHFVGMFKDGKLDQLAEDSIGVHLNVREMGRGETYVIDLPQFNGDESTLPIPTVQLLHQAGAEIPSVLQGVPTVDLPDDFVGVKTGLEELARKGYTMKGALALVNPTSVQEAPGQWDALFRTYGVTALSMTPNVVEIMNRFSRSNTSVFLQSLIQSQGIGLILQVGLEERTNGQRRLFLDA